VTRLDAETATRLARVALANVARPYPHKLDHLLVSAGEALDHRRLHPAFFGSYDWHSAVHMHWTLARIQRLFPSGEIVACLDDHLNETTMAAELAYFHTPGGRTFERPYGWAWVLKLHAELIGTRWEAAAAPLAAELARRSSPPRIRSARAATATRLSLACSRWPIKGCGRPSARRRGAGTSGTATRRSPMSLRWTTFFRRRWSRRRS
jgi:hypothetical protein